MGNMKEFKNSENIQKAYLYMREIIRLIEEQYDEEEPCERILTADQYDELTENSVDTIFQQVGLYKV